jgi:hypothetical protein
VNRSDVETFLRRDRDAVDALRRAHWAAVFREDGPQATFAAGHALLVHARRVRRDWPSAREREDDLAHHVELKRLFMRARGAFAGR